MMKIITVINDPTDFGFNLLRLSCALNDLQLTALVSRESNFTNRIKDELLEDYLSEVSNDEIIFFTDGNDAIMMASETEIVSKFKEAKSDLIFSAEMDCWPDATLAEKYRDQKPTPYKYLNSGGFMGRAGIIKELLKDDDIELEKFKRSNQYVWTQRYFKNEGKILLDVECNIFITFTPQIAFPYSPADSAKYFSSMDEWFHNNFTIAGSRIFNKITHTYGCHAHFNGFSKALMNNYAANMIYKKVPAIKEVQFFYEE